MKGAKGELSVPACRTRSRSRWRTAPSRCSRATRAKTRARQVGHVARPGREPRRGRDQGLREASSRSAASATGRPVQGKVLKLSLGYSHDIDYAIPAGIAIDDAEADGDRRRRHRQAAGRPDRRRDPRVPRPGALQGQGREVRGRVHLPQGRQEEVRSRRHGDETRSRGSAARRACAARSARRRPTAGRACRCSAPRSRSTRRSSTTAAASRSPPPRR